MRAESTEVTVNGENIIENEYDTSCDGRSYMSGNTINRLVNRILRKKPTGWEQFAKEMRRFEGMDMNQMDDEDFRLATYMTTYGYMTYTLEGKVATLRITKRGLDLIDGERWV